MYIKYPSDQLWPANCGVLRNLELSAVSFRLIILISNQILFWVPYLENRWIDLHETWNIGAERDSHD